MRSHPSQLQPRGGEAGLPLLLSSSSVYSAHPGGTRQPRTGAMAPPARSHQPQLRAASMGLAGVSSLCSAELLGIIMRFITFPPITLPVFIRELGGSLGGVTCPGDTGKLSLRPCSSCHSQFELKLLLKLLLPPTLWGFRGQAALLCHLPESTPGAGSRSSASTPLPSGKTLWDGAVAAHTPGNTQTAAPAAPGIFHNAPSQGFF